MSPRFAILVIILGSLAVELLIVATLVPPTTRTYLYVSLVLIVVGYINIQLMRYLLGKKQPRNQPDAEPNAANEKLITSLAVAEKIQKHLLPPNDLNLHCIELYARSRPSEQISGDFYQVISLDDDKTLIAIGDTAGHGLPSAMVSIMVDTLLHAFAHERDLRDVLAKANTILYQRIDPSLFSTLLVLIWDDKKKEFVVSSAGFGRFARYISESQTVAMLKTGGIALGMVADIKQQLHVQNIGLNVGDSLVLCTDGIPEMRNPMGERLGADNWTAIIQKHANSGTAEQIFNNISDELLAFASTAKQVDDITLMIIRRTC